MKELTDRQIALADLIGIAQRILKMRRLANRTGMLEALNLEEVLFVQKLGAYKHLISVADLTASPTISKMLEGNKKETK